MSVPYANLIEAELRTEHDRKAAMDSRAAAMVNTSGALVAVLAAVSAFASASSSALSWFTLVLILVAIAGLVWASFAGIWAGRLMPFSVAKTADMENIVYLRWKDDDDFARRAVADLQRRMILKLRTVNQRKAWWLQAGWCGQVGALILLAAVVVTALQIR